MRKAGNKRGREKRRFSVASREEERDRNAEHALLVHIRSFVPKLTGEERERILFLVLEERAWHGMAWQEGCGGRIVSLPPNNDRVHSINGWSCNK